MARLIFRRVRREKLQQNPTRDVRSMGDGVWQAGGLLWEAPGRRAPYTPVGQLIPDLCARSRQGAAMTKNLSPKQRDAAGSRQNQSLNAPDRLPLVGRLDRQADILLQQGLHRQSERLSHLAAELRQAVAP